jgi:MFS family permease
MSTNIWQFVGLRLLAGIAGGYSSGATILIALQTPKHRVGWALGVLASGVMAGNLLGPLAGGLLPQLIGIRATFWLSGALIFIAFVATVIYLREEPRNPPVAREQRGGGWAQVQNKSIVLAMLGTGLLLMIANMSIEPIITVYVATLVEDPARVTLFSGIVMSTAALGSIVSASRLGRVADRVGHTKVIIVALAIAGVLLIPQAFVTSAWQLIVLRFLMGLSLGGLLPCIAAVIRHNVPENFVGTAMGYSLSSQFSGQVLGPLIGGFLGGQIGMRAVFIGTSVLLLSGAAINRRISHVPIAQKPSSLKS